MERKKLKSYFKQNKILLRIQKLLRRKQTIHQGTLFKKLINLLDLRTTKIILRFIIVMAHFKIREEAFSQVNKRINLIIINSLRIYT